MTDMLNLKDNNENYILVRFKRDKTEAWQAPRGFNVEDPTERWTLNPDQAHVYKNLAAVLNAAERLKEKYPNEFADVKIIPLDNFKEENQKKAFKSIAELREYFPKVKKIFALEHLGNNFYFASEDERDSYVKEQQLNDYTTYDLKLV